jgi:hypothetical protein
MRFSPRFATVSLFSIALACSMSLAQTPDGSTPANEGICDSLQDATPSLYGLCVAYCEALDCQHIEGGLVQCNSAPSNKILENYNKKKAPSDPPMPCVVPPPPPPLPPCACWTPEELSLIQPGFCRLTEGSTSTTFPCSPPLTDYRCNDGQCSSFEAECVNNFDPTPVSGFNTCTNLNDTGCFTLEGSAGGAFVTNSSSTSTPSYRCAILFKTGTDLSDVRETIRIRSISVEEALSCSEQLQVYGDNAGWTCF